MALPSAMPAGWPLAWRAWHSLRNPSMSLGMPSNPASLIQVLR